MADVRALLEGLPEFDETAADAALARERSLHQRMEERGRLPGLALWLAGWQAGSPRLTKPELCVFAGANGLVDAAAARLAHVQTRERLVMLASGGSATNTGCAAANAGLRLFELAVDSPTPAPGAAGSMSEIDCVRTIGFGLEAVSTGADVLGIAAFGTASREAAASLALALLGGDPMDWVAGGQFSLNRREALDHVREAASRARGGDGLDLLCQTGSREIAAATGAILAARTQKIPVILSGFEATMAAALLAHVRPGSIDHCLLAARDGSAAHDRLIACLALEPLIDMPVAAPDGLAAAMVFSMLRLAVDIHAGLPTSAQLQSLQAPALGHA
jgi:nicotinate-nucleotide--dimethylbenzimidazole phosphoribosyltransferase